MPHNKKKGGFNEYISAFRLKRSNRKMSQNEREIAIKAECFRTETWAPRVKPSMSTEINQERLEKALRGYREIAGQRHLHDRWAYHFLRDVLGFGPPHVLAYRMSGREKRPLLLVKREDEILLGLETGKPPVHRHEAVPFLLLFTGDEWQLFDVTQRPLLITCLPRAATADDYSVLHATQCAQWPKLATQVRECGTDVLVEKLLSPAMLGSLKSELKADVSDKVLLHQVRAIITGATPLPETVTQRKAS